MKKSLIIALILFLAIAAIVLLTWHIGYNNGQNQMIDHCYPIAGIVTDVDCAADTVTVTDCAGLSWTFIGTEDWYEGDIASCVMHDNNTPDSVYDDVIIKVYYAGIIENNTFWISDKWWKEKQAIERDLSADRARTYFHMLDALPYFVYKRFMDETQNDTDEMKIEKLKHLYMEYL